MTPEERVEALELALDEARTNERLWARAYGLGPTNQYVDRRCRVWRVVRELLEAELGRAEVGS